MNETPPRIAARLVRYITSPYGILAVLALLCHGVLLLCDYKIWDGWFIENIQREGRFDVLWRWYFEVGVPHYYFLYRLFGLSIHRIWLHKFASLGAYLGIACGLYYTIHRSGFLKKPEALMASAFMLTFPGMMTLGEAALTPYVLGLFVFFIAAAMAVRSEFSTGGRYAALRVLAEVLFLVGLTYYYALVPFYLVFYLFFVDFLRRRYLLRRPIDMGRAVVQHFDYLILPLFFWWLKGKLAPTSGFYEGYRTLHFDLNQFLSSWGLFFNSYLFLHLSEMISNWPALVCGAAVALLTLRYGRASMPEPSSKKPQGKPRGKKTKQKQASGYQTQRELYKAACLFAFGCFAVFMGAFPYLMIGRLFYAYGYVSNSNLLIPIGAALILTAFLGAVRLLLVRWDGKGAVSAGLIAYLLTSFICIWTSNYLSWEAVCAKEQSLATKLRDDANAQVCSIFLVDDRFVIPKTDIYPTAMASVQFEDALHKRSVFAFHVTYNPAYGRPSPLRRSTLDKIMLDTTIPYFFNEVDLTARQALVFITEGRRHYTPIDIGLRYLLLKRGLSSSNEELSRFLDDLVEIQVVPLQ